MLSRLTEYLKRLRAAIAYRLFLGLVRVTPVAWLCEYGPFDLRTLWASEVYGSAYCWGEVVYGRLTLDCALPPGCEEGWLPAASGSTEERA